MLRNEVEYVQGIADGDVPNAEAIIQSAGMSVKKITLPTRPEFSVKNGEVSGEVILRAKGAGARSVHEWQMGTGPEFFGESLTTVLATTKLTGLTPMSKYYFRHRVVGPGGAGPWSAVLSLVIT